MLGWIELNNRDPARCDCREWLLPTAPAPAPIHQHRCHRLVESAPYPISALTMPIFFEVGSLWSYLSFVVKNRGPDVLRALGWEEVRERNRHTLTNGMTGQPV
jgi:hypothetical protein